MKLLSLNIILVLFILSSCNQTRNNKEETQSPDTQTDTLRNKMTKINNTDSTGELTEFIPDGHEILDIQRGDLNNDKIEDFLLVLKAVDEKETPDTSNPTPRPLLILIRQPDNSLQLARKNNKTVYCVNCGGMMGDPYMGLTIRDNYNYFSVEHYGGSSWRWSKIITYKFDEDDQEWYLHKINEISYYVHDEKNTKEETIKTSMDFGVIKFEDYDIYEEKNSTK